MGPPVSAASHLKQRIETSHSAATALPWPSVTHRHLKQRIETDLVWRELKQQMATISISNRELKHVFTATSPPISTYTASQTEN